ncbi:hypothetical protein, partial [Caenispirillum bisanense]|uniref:hypothetical protein n=1 Tax=Caenispirillum bisanense TaxID=414052 RepID=UPI0031E2636E
VGVGGGPGPPPPPAGPPAAAAAAAEIARRGRFRAAAAVIKGEPALPAVLAALPPGRRVVLVPHLAGDGRFAADLIPALAAAHGGHLGEVRVLPALGGSAVIPAHVEALLGHVAETVDAPPDLLVVAHGAASATAGDRAAEHLAHAVGGSAVCRSAHTVFLEHAPRLTDWRRLPLGRDVVACVMLAARGRHARLDVPPAFGLPAGTPLVTPAGEAVGPFVVDGRRLWLHAPLADPRLMADAAELAAVGALGTPATTETHLAGRTLDHSQGALAATA